MGSIAKWGFRIKLAFFLAVGSFVTMFLLVAMFGEDYGGLLESVFLILTLILFISGILIPFLVLLDARAIKRTDCGWSPRPWFWFISIFLFYGLPFLIYMYFRRKNVEYPTPSLGSVLLQTFPFSRITSLSRDQMSSGHGEITKRDKWTRILKAATLLYFLWFLFEGYLPTDSILATIFAISAIISYFTIGATVWLDGKAVYREGEWKPNYQLWAIASLFLLAFPALLYLALRQDKIGSMGPPLIGAIPSSHSGNLTRGTIRREKRHEEPEDPPKSSKLIDEAEENLQRAEQLLARGKYVEARDAYKEALSGFEEVKARISKHRGINTDLEEKIETAERGIEDCWVRPLTEKVDEAEELLESGQVKATRSNYEQVAEALEARTFEYTETQELLHRVEEGLERTNPDGDG